MTTDPARPGSTGHRQLGPPLAAPAIVAGVLTVACLVLGASGPRPDTAPSGVLDFFRDHDTRAHLLAFALFATAMPLAVWTATAYRRLRRLGVTAPGAAITLVGGSFAAISIALSGLATWVAAESSDVTGRSGAELSRTVYQLSFATGGTGFTAPLALAIAGLAVSGLLAGFLPRPLAWAGLVIAVIGVVSTGALLTSALYPTLPVVRFGGLVWIVVAGFVLPKNRHDVSKER